MTAVEEVRAACRLLGRDPLPPAEAAAVLGETQTDYGIGCQITFRPRAAAFSDGQLVRAFDADLVSHVVLTLAAGAEVPFAEVAAAFGDGKEESRLHSHEPRQQVFQVAQPDLPCDCAVLAELRATDAGTDVVVAFTLRRDVRAER